jgi:hypothetical protein
MTKGYQGRVQGRLDMQRCILAKRKQDEKLKEIKLKEDSSGGKKK